MVSGEAATSAIKDDLLLYCQIVALDNDLYPCQDWVLRSWELSPCCRVVGDVAVHLAS